MRGPIPCSDAQCAPLSHDDAFYQTSKFFTMLTDLLTARMGVVPVVVYSRPTMCLGKYSLRNTHI